MKKAKIYIPTKTAMQSGRGKNKYWVLEYDTLDSATNPFMGWESSKDTMAEVKIEFSTKEKAINFARLNNIEYKIIEPKKRKLIIKSYADNFKNN